MLEMLTLTLCVFGCKFKIQCAALKKSDISEALGYLGSTVEICINVNKYKNLLILNRNIFMNISRTSSAKFKLDYHVEDKY